MFKHNLIEILYCINFIYCKMTGGTHPKRKAMKYCEEQLQLFIFRVTHQGTKLLLITSVTGILIRKTRH